MCDVARHVDCRAEHGRGAMMAKKHKPFALEADGEAYHVVKLMIPLDMKIEHVIHSLCDRGTAVMVKTEGDGEIKSYVLTLIQ